ncbi:hypothetical protein [Phenylobacterium sp.]|uniref:hypothetical protein n=1 Tax=Phenylobacterium sp. TaxID=1871053 RepID=UPI002FC5AA48
MTSWKTLSAAFVGLAALCFAASADAHGSMKPQHGGVVQMTGETRFELVNAPAGVALYVKEDEEDVESAGLTVRLTITTKAGKTSNVQMAPAGGNKLEAKGLKLAPGSKVGVMLVNKATQARASTTFTIN